MGHRPNVELNLKVRTSLRRNFFTERFIKYLTQRIKVTLLTLEPCFHEIQALRYNSTYLLKTQGIQPDAQHSLKEVYAGHFPTVCKSEVKVPCTCQMTLQTASSHLPVRICHVYYMPISLQWSC